jgi:predicted transcriptional regulator
LEKPSSRYRDRLYMIANVVEYLVRYEVASKTEIMNHCRLRHDQINDLLRVVIDSGFARRIDTDEGERYRVEQHGRDWFVKWAAMYSDVKEQRKPKKLPWSRNIQDSPTP